MNPPPQQQQPTGAQPNLLPEQLGGKPTIFTPLLMAPHILIIMSCI